ncbi:MAG TPA: aminopeptidase [Deltaproteobacteria bacterium]|nr:aminopeptidase [Deltaproteobacteria bacterium]
MLTSGQMERYAGVLMWGLATARGRRCKKGDIVLIRADERALPLAERVYELVVEMGCHPVMRVTLTPVMERAFYGKSSTSQLVFCTPGERELFSSLNGLVTIRAPESITHLADVRPERIAKATLARKYLNDILDEREAKGLFGWTLCLYPTQELARHAGMSIEEYTGQIVDACRLDVDDPVAWWKETYGQAQEIKRWLNGMKIKRLFVQSDTTDLVVTPGASRKWVGISGHNIPSFEIFVSPDWRGTSGRFYADQPSYRSGNYVKGVELEFDRGVVVKARARDGEEFLLKQIAMDRGASRLGEFSLTDRRFSRINAFMANTLYDENYGGEHGNCHIALGDSYADTYDGDASLLSPQKKRSLGFNDSALHWDLVNTERKRVTAELGDGKRVTIYEDGVFSC